MRLTPNCKGSVFAWLKDHTGEIGCAIGAPVFEEYPSLLEGSTLLMKDVNDFSFRPLQIFFR